MLLKKKRVLKASHPLTSCCTWRRPPRGMRCRHRWTGIWACGNLLRPRNLNLNLRNTLVTNSEIIDFLKNCCSLIWLSRTSFHIQPIRYIFLPWQENNANLSLLLALEPLEFLVGELEGLAVVGDLMVGEGVNAIEEEALVPFGGVTFLMVTCLHVCMIV